MGVKRGGRGGVHVSEERGDIKKVGVKKERRADTPLHTDIYIYIYIYIIYIYIYIILLYIYIIYIRHKNDKKMKMFR